MKFPDLKLIVHCHCKQASFLASEALERKLTFSERWAMRLHHAICSHCRRVARQFRQLHHLAARMPDDVRRSFDASCDRLSPLAKTRIVESMHRSDD